MRSLQTISTMNLTLKDLPRGKVMARLVVNFERKFGFLVTNSILRKTVLLKPMRSLAVVWKHGMSVRSTGLFHSECIGLS